VDQYDMLDDKGNIQDYTILLKVQQLEAMRMRWDVEFLKYYLEGSEFNYDFLITELPVENIMEEYFTKGDIAGASSTLHIERKALSIVLMKILVEDEYTGIREALIRDYLKDKHKYFPTLKDKYGIDGYVKTDKFKRFLKDKRCKNILFKWCTGLDLGADDPMKLVALRDSIIDSIKRTLNNLLIELSVGAADEKYLRFMKVREWIRNLKAEAESEEVKINSDKIKDYIKEINGGEKRLYNPNDIKVFVQDIKDIFDVEVTKKSDSTEYLIREEWTIDNIRGIRFFAESRRYT
jgi:hypothetical protein